MARNVVPRALDDLIGAAHGAMQRPMPPLKYKDQAWHQFFLQCGPAQVFALGRAHVAALQAIAQLAADFKRVGCRCGEVDRSDGVHVDICPITILQHASFQVFERTAAPPAPADPAPADPAPAPATTP